jgi:hypothetical protein
MRQVGIRVGAHSCQRWGPSAVLICGVTVAGLNSGEVIAGGARLAPRRDYYDMRSLEDRVAAALAPSD